ncbi:Uncharacterized protein TCM_041511 [Theobroma cacao]|uniref:Uncharacterized protein n=1 Tax=Theobroma cacao TaxID=3641 RepID=A0A061GUN2_THECC|nr:Uncharacterized protein TCM_041511 [Theobroma cacao]
MMAGVKRKQVKKLRSGGQKREKFFLVMYPHLMRVCIKYKGIEASENGMVQFWIQQ